MAQTYQDLLAAARAEIPELQVAELAERLEGAQAPVLIDVREQSEWDEGHVAGAIHVPRGYLESRIAGVAAHDAPIVLMCAGGMRSLLAARNLVRWGICTSRAWPADSPAGSIRAGIRRSADTHPEQRARYSRHLLIPEIGEEGQLSCSTRRSC